MIELIFWGAFVFAATAGIAHVVLLGLVGVSIYRAHRKVESKLIVK